MSRRVLLLYREDALELPRGVITVGRDLGCGLRIHDPSVSRRHLRFVHRSDEVFVEDLSSTNGTLLNGQPVFEPRRLQDGDCIELGDREITLQILSSDATADLEPQTEVKGPPRAAEDDEEPTRSSAKTVSISGSSLEQALKQTTRIPRPEAVKSTVRIPRPEGLLEEPPQHRCPNCAAEVEMTTEVCQSCGHSWGEFSPRVTTKVGARVLKERRHPRHEVVVPLIYRSSAMEVEAATRDLSMGGVFVCTAYLDPKGTECELTILIDGGPPVSLAGRVQRVVRQPNAQNNGLGVEFTEVSAEAKQWLRSVLARHAVD